MDAKDGWRGQQRALSRLLTAVLCGQLSHAGRILACCGVWRVGGRTVQRSEGGGEQRDGNGGYITRQVSQYLQKSPDLDSVFELFVRHPASARQGTRHCQGTPPGPARPPQSEPQAAVGTVGFVQHTDRPDSVGLGPSGPDFVSYICLFGKQGCEPFQFPSDEIFILDGILDGITL